MWLTNVDVEPAVPVTSSSSSNLRHTKSVASSQGEAWDGLLFLSLGREAWDKATKSERCGHIHSIHVALPRGGGGGGCTTALGLVGLV